MFDYSHLDALLAVEREGSIDGAARSIGISSSAISQRLRVLEERIGAVTVVRQKPATPTNFGKILCRHAEKVMLMESELIDDNSEHFSDLAGETNMFKIAVDETSLSTWFAGTLDVNTGCKNKVLFDLTVVEESLTVEMMKDGDALAAVSSEKDPVQGYRSLFLGSQVFRAVMSPTFKEENFEGAITAEKVLSCPVIRRNQYDDMYRRWMSENFGFELDIKCHTIPSTQGVLSAVTKNIGWAVCATETVDPLIESGDLVEILPEKTLKKDLYWHYSRAVSSAIAPITESIRAVGHDTLSQSSRAKNPCSEAIHKLA